VSAGLGLDSYDHIDCSGVLHHLPDPVAGARTLASLLKPDGGMSIMLYGALGRTGVYAAQEMLRMLAGEDDPKARVALARRLLRALPPTNWLKRNPFVSDHLEGGDAGLYDLLLRHRAGELRCDIPLIVSNHPDLKPVADQFGIDFEIFPVSADNKAAQEERELERLAAHRIDVIALARYMQILSGDFVAHYPARIINIHHSFLPAFSGGRPYHQASARGVKLIGATAHYATVDLDEGPIIEQDVIRTSHRDSVADLTRKGRDLERSVLSHAVRWHLEDRVLVYGNKTVVFSG